MQTSGRVLTSFAGLPLAIATALTGMLGRVLLVVGAFACGLLLLDALFSALEWILTHDQRALVDAAGFLAEAAIPFIATVVGAYCREKLRRSLEARRARKLAAEAGSLGHRLGKRGLQVRPELVEAAARIAGQVRFP